MSKPLYTFILAHYNQYGYIFSAIDSILMQDYQSIEVVVMDDFSPHFDRDEVISYINNHKNTNLKSVKVLVNKENIGTVRSMNRALKASTGSLIQLFAADDRLHDNNVASRFVNEFERHDDDTEMLCAYALVMDEDLTPPGELHIAPHIHEQYNKMTSYEQFGRIALNCNWAMGAICVRRELYERMGFFVENYKFVEDWPFFLRISRNGAKVRCVDFEALDHRDGGISRNLVGHDTKNAQIYLNDILLAFEVEVFPFIKDLPVVQQANIIEKYLHTFFSLVIAGGMRRKLYGFDFFKFSPKGTVWRYLAKWRQHNNKFILWSLCTSYFAALIFFVASGQTGLAGGWVEMIAGVSGVLFICAFASLFVNVLMWLSRRAYRVYRARKVIL